MQINNSYEYQDMIWQWRRITNAQILDIDNDIKQLVLEDNGETLADIVMGKKEFFENLALAFTESLSAWAGNEDTCRRMLTEVVHDELYGHTIPGSLEATTVNILMHRLFPSFKPAYSINLSNTILNIDPLTLGFSPDSLEDAVPDSRSPYYPQHQRLRYAWKLRQDKLIPAQDSPHFAPRSREQSTGTDPMDRFVRRDAIRRQRRQAYERNNRPNILR